MSKSISYPHPVLGNDDDVNGSFAVDISVTKKAGEDNITFSVDSKIDNEYFQNLQDQGKAAVVTKVYCPSTIYSGTFQNAKVFALHQDDIDGAITVTSYIVAIVDIPDYKDESFNADIFENITFEVNSGDVIGALSGQKIDLPKVDEKTGLGNIFRFTHKEMGEPISVFVEDELIEVTYSMTFDGKSPLNALFNQSPWVALHVYIMPALISALQSVKKDHQHYEDNNYRWYKTLKGIIGEEAMRDPEPVEHAQEILLREGLLPSLQVYNELIGG